jgi:tripeptidyl-peptidase-1
VDSVDGGTAPVRIGTVRSTGESDIDIQLAYSLIYPQQVSKKQRTHYFLNAEPKKVTVYQVDDLPNSSGETRKGGLLNTFFDAVDGSYCNFTAFGITGDSPKIDPVYPDPHKGGFKGQLECGKYELTRVLSISYVQSYWW